MCNQTSTKDSEPAAQLVFNEPKRAHITPLFISLHWLQVVAYIKFKTLTFVSRTATGSTPSNLHTVLCVYIPSRSLRLVSQLPEPSQKCTKSFFRTYSFTVLCWWNDLPIHIRITESLAIFTDHKLLSNIINSTSKLVTSHLMISQMFPS